MWMCPDSEILPVMGIFIKPALYHTQHTLPNFKRSILFFVIKTALIEGAEIDFFCILQPLMLDFSY